MIERRIYVQIHKLDSSSKRKRTGCLIYGQLNKIGLLCLEFCFVLLDLAPLLTVIGPSLGQIS